MRTLQGRTMLAGVLMVLLAGTAWGQPKGLAGPPAGMPASAPASGPATASRPRGADEEMSVSLNDMPLDKIAAFLGEKLGKPVLVGDESIKGKKITVLCKQKLPAREAMFLVRLALLDQGVLVEEQENFIRLRPVGDLMRTNVVRLPPEIAAGSVPDRLRIAVKEFRVQHADVTAVAGLIRPTLPAWGSVMVDADTRRMSVTDTIAGLMRTEAMVAALDTPEAQRVKMEIIPIANGDAVEIVAVVRWMVVARLGLAGKEITPPASSGVPAQPSQPSPDAMERERMMRMRGMSVASSGQPSQPPQPADAGAVTVAPAKSPVTLIPNVTRNWVIVVAPTDLFAQIKTWILELDKTPDKEKEYELYDVQHAELDQLARELAQMIQALPTAELRDTVRVVPFGKARKLIVFGPRTGRAMVKDLLAKLDTPEMDKRTSQTFGLKHLDAEEMAGRIEKLFGQPDNLYARIYGYYDYGYGYGGGRRQEPEPAKVSFDKRNNTVTVVADTKTLKEIAEMIAREDKPIDPKDVVPRVYKLKYADPGEVGMLLSEMFSEKKSAAASVMEDMFFGPYTRARMKQLQTTPVGRLLGQFTFQVLPGSGKLVVNARNAANYPVIDAIIEELDKPERAGVPLIIELKHANAEDLCEQINALLAEPGTMAKVGRSNRTLTMPPAPGLMTTGASATAAGGSNPSGPYGGSESTSRTPEVPGAGAGEYGFWWSSGYKPQPGQMPPSNLVGKIRVVPVPRRNALMVLAPEGYLTPIGEMIDAMDQPGRMVVIKARVGEIQHEGQTTLGLRIASDASLLSVSSGDSAILGGASAKYSKAFFNNSLVLESNASLFAMINLLMREFKMKILMEPAITTSDNEAGEYKDVQVVWVQVGSSRSTEGLVTGTDLREREVGTMLRVRPHVTQNGNVDLLIKLEISRIIPGQTVQGNVVIDRREVTTHVIVKNGQSILLSGIVRSEDFEDVRKVPGWGDLPGEMGRMFRHVDKGTRNRELVLLVTPTVLDTDAAADAQSVRPLRVLRELGRGSDMWPELKDAPAFRKAPK